MSTTPNAGYTYKEVVGSVDGTPIAWEYLARRWDHSTAQQWLRRIECGELFINDRQAGPDDRVSRGDVLIWRRPPWIEPSAPLDFAILFNDGDLLAVAKPEGLPTLPGAGFLENTLLSLVRKKFDNASPLHRLGRATSGIVLFSLNASSASFLQQKWNISVRKIYRALVNGVITEDLVDVRAPIGLVPHRLLGSVYAVSPEGKASRSKVHVLERRADRTLVDVEIFTGRPHQIRIHLASIGHPLVGDDLYPVGGVPDLSTQALPGDLGYYLHARYLQFDHPRTDITTEITCLPPPILRLFVGSA